MTAWGNLPPALPSHDTVLAWARGCRCEECEREYQRFGSELAVRGPLGLPAQPEPRVPPAFRADSPGARTRPVTRAPLKSGPVPRALGELGGSPHELQHARA